MTAPVGIKEVAAHAQVSVATVSNVLNRPDIVAAPTRGRVLASIEMRGATRPTGTGQVIFEPELVVRQSSQVRPRRAVP